MNCGPARNQTCPTEITRFGTARARLGYQIMNGIVVFVTGGFALGDIHAYKEGVFYGGGETLRGGWTAGGGVEAMVAPHVSVKVEYLYTDFPGAERPIHSPAARPSTRSSTTCTSCVTA